MTPRSVERWKRIRAPVKLAWVTRLVSLAREDNPEHRALHQALVRRAAEPPPAVALVGAADEDMRRLVPLLVELRVLAVLDNPRYWFARVSFVCACACARACARGYCHCA